MAAWLPALKAILPYVAQVVTVAIPVFTKKTDKGPTDEIIPQQIQELQGAVTRNAESLKLLADQLQQAIATIDAGAVKIEREMRTIRLLCIASIVTSGAAVAVAALAWLR
jgi:hypothetical protein